MLEPTGTQQDCKYAEGLERPERQRERDQENQIITFYSDKKKLKPDKKDINTMLSNYVDVSISRIKEYLRLDHVTEKIL